MESEQSLRIFVDARRFATGPEDTWLIDDLVTAMSDGGHHVDVLIHDVKTAHKSGPQRDDRPGVRLFRVGPPSPRGGRIGKVLDYVQSAWSLWTVGRRYVTHNRYDVGVFFSPGFLSFGLPSWLRRNGNIDCLVFVLWDFFPVHHIEIGRIRSRKLHRPLKAIERAAILSADRITVMSPKNAEFLSGYHARLSAEIVEVAPWAHGNVEVVPFASAPPFKVVFGGQIAPGRGIETIVEAARRLDSSPGPAVQIIVVGSGPSLEGAEALARGVSSIRFVARMSRSDYRTFLSGCHAGIAATVEDVSVPTFPSKIVDYTRHGLPVLLSIEASSDVGQIVQEAGAGLLTEVGNAAALAEAVLKLRDQYFKDGLLQMREKSQDLYSSRFSSLAASSWILHGRSTVEDES